MAMARHLIILEWKYGSSPKFEGLDFGYGLIKLYHNYKSYTDYNGFVENFILESLQKTHILKWNDIMFAVINSVVA